jgi:poly-gamma-glutamate synthesis protein (capsule biosynthesis protein)
MTGKLRIVWIIMFLGGSMLAACSPAVSPTPIIIIPPPQPTATFPAPQKDPTETTQVFRVFIDPSVPDKLREPMRLPDGMLQGGDSGTADATFGTVPSTLASSEWIYALAAPFTEVGDEVSTHDLVSAWKENEPPDFLHGQIILVNPSTRATFAALWGEPGKNIKTRYDNSSLLDAAWAGQGSFAIIPFEQIGPRWKIIHVDGQSPLDKHFDNKNYPLTIYYGWKGQDGVVQKLHDVPLIKTNRDPDKMTIITMTGTTAMVRSLGAKMEQNGMTYPVEGGILDWFWNADFVHISNEVSFADNCPPGNPAQKSLQFCSRPEYLQLLQYIHANIIELTGNHIIDWDLPAFEHTLKLYQDNHMMVYAGGLTSDAARAPLKIEHNGNKIAFLGCDPAGPDLVWALPDRAGNARCDYPWMISQIQQLKADGYLPIVTLQYFEGYTLQPTPQQKLDFDALSDAGAVIVSGSQAHFPQTMTFRGDRFVHYGLGNMFFDMMRNPYDLGTKMDLGGTAPIAGVRIGVADRHIFYDGQYINTELLTDVLENFAQPRPLTADERQHFLAILFKAADW